MKLRLSTSPTPQGEFESYLARDRRRVGERVSGIARWGFLIVFFLINNFIGPQVMASHMIVNSILAIWALGNIALTVLLTKTKEENKILSAFALAFDILVGGSAVYFSNGFYSPFFLAFFVVIIAASVRYGMLAAMLAAIAASSVYLVSAGVAPSISSVTGSYLSSEILGRLILFFSLAAVSSILARQLMHERELAVRRATDLQALQVVQKGLSGQMTSESVAYFLLESIAGALETDTALLCAVFQGGYTQILHKCGANLIPSFTFIARAAEYTDMVLSDSRHHVAAKLFQNAGVSFVIYLRSAKGFTDDQRLLIARLIPATAGAIRSAIDQAA